MKKLVKFSMMICLAASLCACEDEKKTEETPYFGVEAKYLTQTFEREADIKYVTVKTNQAFTATSSGTWCTPEVLGDKTADNLKISVTALDDVSPRTATITVSCQGFESAVITVTQNGIAATFSVTPREPANIEGSGGDLTFTVTANSAWSYSISENGSWLAEKEKTAVSLVLTARENVGNSTRSAALQFFLTDHPSQSQEITVSQSAFQPQLTVTPPAVQNIVKSGGDATFTIEANTAWSYSISGNGSWLAEKEKTAASFTLTAANNDLWGGRSAVITISLTDYPEYTHSYAVKQSGAADMLDVLFNTDGTADDVSPMANTVEWKNYNNPLSVAYDDTYKRNIVTFNPSSNGQSPGADNASYYSINYQNNAEFQSKLADGHTFECLVKFDVNYAETAQGYETKFFSSHEGGGTGFIISNTGGADPNGIAFLPNIPATEGGNSRWIWANSARKPDGQSYYHLVGVWNQTEKKAYLYINGTLAKEIAADGFYRPAQLNPRWVAIGGDAGSNQIQNTFQGKIVIARIYDSPLTASDAQTLYNEINPNPAP
ncbi:MAG: hypothetical protein LBD87_03405 [Prevotellaceae bacterium]|jgi:hypothetical protein|nr:hypothetical protein [Prevotellaceae bacterium]